MQTKKILLIHHCCSAGLWAAARLVEEYAHRGITAQIIVKNIFMARDDGLLVKYAIDPDSLHHWSFLVDNGMITRVDNDQPAVMPELLPPECPAMPPGAPTIG